MKMGNRAQLKISVPSKTVNPIGVPYNISRARKAYFIGNQRRVINLPPGLYDSYGEACLVFQILGAVNTEGEHQGWGRWWRRGY